MPRIIIFVLDKLLSHELNTIQIAVMKCVLRCFCGGEKKTNRFSIELWRATKSGSRAAIAGDQHSDSTMVALRTLLRARVASTEGYGRILVVCS